MVLPSYNSGSMLLRTASEALAYCPDLWVVIDGSTDGSQHAIRRLAAAKHGVEVIERSTNGGKGAAVLDALRALSARRFTHALVMDADGQHPSASIPQFLDAARHAPQAMVLGTPVFGPDAPAERIHGRRVGNFFAELETLWGGVKDSLFGFRVYPVDLALRTLQATPWGRGYDFDTVLAVRLFWAGVRPINLPVRVYYPPRKEGGVSHFHYLRDNFVLAGTHLRLCFEVLTRLQHVWHLRQKWHSHPDSC